MKKAISFLIIIISFASLSYGQVNADWVLFEKDGMKMTFPKIPAEQKQTLNTAAGPLLLSIYSYEPAEEDQDENILYSVTDTEFPDSLINSSRTGNHELFFRNAIDGAVKNVNGKLLAEKNISMKTYPGREARIDFQDGLAVITMRAFLVDNRMYILQTITATEKDFNKSMTRFLDSFILTE